MFDYQQEATRTSPYVMLDSSEARIEIKGSSSPDNAVQFYYPIIRKIKDLFIPVRGVINVDISMEYFNTSSSKCIFDVLRLLKKLDHPRRKVVINWHYEEEDDDMLETGEDYADLLGLDFKYVAIAYS
ncbi:MAG: DUF1987 domain-containing protein [Marinoscillum sp.]